MDLVWWKAGIRIYFSLTVSDGWMQIIFYLRINKAIEKLENVCLFFSKFFEYLTLDSTWSLSSYLKFLLCQYLFCSYLAAFKLHFLTGNNKLQITTRFRDSTWHIRNCNCCLFFSSRLIRNITYEFFEKHLRFFWIFRCAANLDNMSCILMWWVIVLWQISPN